MAKSVIIIPCYNEAKRLDLAAFRSFSDSAREVKILFVNDGSADATGAMLDEFCSAAPERLDVRHLVKNGGKAEAVRQGVLAALAEAPDSVGFWDADLATPLDLISEFGRVLETRPKIEMVFGLRLHRHSDAGGLAPAVRRCLGGLFPALARRAARFPARDTQCGAKLFRVTETLPRLFGEPFVTRWFFDVEILARFARERRGRDCPPPEEVLYEFPLECWRDVEGSKRALRTYVSALFDLLAIYRKYR